MEERDPMLKQVRAKVNDKDHEILYKSPGPHRGSKGRSIDHLHVTTKEEAAAAIAEGWSTSEEEAHDLADALKAGKKGRKHLVRRKEADEVDEDEDTEEEADDEGGEDEEDPILAAPKKAKKGKKKGK